MLVPKKNGNDVKIEGILSEIDLKESTFNKNNSPMKSIGGSIKVRVDQEVNGTKQVLEIPVYMFAGEYTNAGAPNPAYESIKRVMFEYKSIAAVGIDAADRVRIDKANITMNEYYGKNGNLVSFPRIRASFVTKMSASDCKPQATFSTIFVVASMGYALDKDGVEDTSKYEIQGIIPKFGGSVDIVEFVTASPKVTSVVSSAWQKNDTVTASGRLNFSSTVETKLKEVDFGEPIEETRTISVSELVITGGNSTPLTDDFAYDLTDIQAGVKARQANLAKLKENAGTSGKAPTANSKASIDLGF